jgi:hypothetical protein
VPAFFFHFFLIPTNMNAFDSIATSASKLANEGVPIKIEIPVNSGLVLAIALTIPIVIGFIFYAGFRKNA